VPNSPSVNVAGNGLTIEMWAFLNPNSLEDYVLVGKPWTAGTTGIPPYQFGLEYDANGNNTFDFYFGDAVGVSHGPYSIAPAESIWTHVAYTLDGTAVRGYLDGVLKLQTSVAAGIQARATDLLIGVDGSLGQSLNGRLDDVRIYNRALTQAEIQSDMGRAAAPAVPPVPDGTYGTAMTAARGDAAGSTINLTWDVSTCASGDHHALYGPLASVASVTISGASCDLGTTGSATWTGVPAGSLWFTIVGDDNATVEASWGTNGTGGQRGGTTASGQCGTNTRDNSGTCP
jgi:hypothetical protein